MATKRYCQLVTASAVAVLALIALFNVLVDPFGAYPAIHLKTFDPFRGSVFTRLARAEMARSGKWEMVILGTSRPKGGMPAGHPAFASNHVCNLSLDAAHMSEIETIFHYTRARNPLRRVLLCLDMTISRPPGPLEAEFLESRFNPKLSVFEYHCKNVIGAAATDESFKFLVRRMARRFPPEGQQNGFQVRSLARGMEQRAVFERTLRSLAYNYAIGRPIPEGMNALRRLLATCREENIQLTLAINPVHALDLELLRTAGGWERLEDWKRQVVKLIAEESLEDRVAFWDFTDYSQPTTEEVPLSGDTTTRMKLYFENSHYTPAMGALMLDQMFRGATNDFGVRISTTNIEAHLQKVRRDREAYVASHAADVEWTQRVGKRVLAARKQIGALVDDVE